MKIKRKFSEVIYFAQLINSLTELKKESKARTAVEATARSIEKTVFVDYNDQLEGLRVKNCAEDEKTKVILKKEGQYEFTKAGHEAFRKDVKTLGETDVEFNINQIDEKEFEGTAPDIIDTLVEFGFLIRQTKEESKQDDRCLPDYLTPRSEG
jgi:hypothetical protein